MTDTTEARRKLLSLLLDRVEREALLPDEAPLLRPLVAADQADADRAEQAEDLLHIAHETSNRSEAEREQAAQRAERAYLLVGSLWEECNAIIRETETDASENASGHRQAVKRLRAIMLSGGDGPSPMPDDAPPTPVLDALRTGQPVELLFCSPLVNAACPGHDAPPYCDRAPSSPATPAAAPEPRTYRLTADGNPIERTVVVPATVTDWATSVDERCPAHYKGDPPLLSQPVWQSVDYRCERRGHGLDTDHAIRLAQGSGTVVFGWADTIAIYPTSDTMTTTDDAPSEPQQ